MFVFYFKYIYIPEVIRTPTLVLFINTAYIITVLSYTHLLTSIHLLISIQLPVGRLQGLKMGLGQTLREPLKHRF